ncbi:MAG: hypothetical protein ACTS73_02615 [Arsenophonus sp. NEOnobi-MAG3]
MPEILLNLSPASSSFQQNTAKTFQTKHQELYTVSRVSFRHKPSKQLNLNFQFYAFEE